MRHLWPLLVLIFVNTAVATPGDTEFLAAREAFQRGAHDRVAELAPALRTHPLMPYVEWWQLRSRLAEFPRDDVRRFLDRNAGQLVANRLRADWLKALARQRDWEAFDAAMPQLVDPDTEMRCLHFQSRLQRNDREALRDGRALWLTGRDLPDACTPVFDAAFAAGVLDEDDAWARVRLAFASGNATLARAVALRVPAGRRPDAKLVDAATRNPQKYLDAKAPLLRHRGDREVVLYALGRLAGGVPQGAAQTWRRIEPRLPNEDRAFAWSLLATAAARKHLPEALTWFREAGPGVTLDDGQSEWRARAALRAKDWQELASAIEAMRSEVRDTPVWRYWRARGLREQGREMEAGAIFAVLANDHGFHGLLAREDLGPAVGAPPENYKPKEDEIRAAAQIPGFQRALSFYRMGLRYEGNLEWMWTVRGLDDVQLLSAAELARREGWYERAIATADRTKKLTNMELRYPTPYQDLLRASAREFDLDDAWIYGLIRQESRFTASAKSTVGASGLMQVMPATAKWIAGKLGLSEWRHAVGDGADANISFGTFYLRHVLDRLDGSPVLASAAYNAGPGRAQGWRATSPMESAIYIDTIPFTETRDYVRKVMANATQYARLLGRPQDSLRTRIGTVPARAGAGPAEQ